MIDYSLLPGEIILQRATGIYYKSSMFSGFEDELVLTNLHLIHVDRGLIKVKSIRKIPLEQIIVSRVYCEKNEEDDEYELQIQLKSGERLAYQFNDGKRLTRRWVEYIRSAARENDTEQNVYQEPSILDDIKGLATGLIKDVLFTNDEPVTPVAHFSPAQQKTVYSPPPQPKKITKKCIGCGAPISGAAGQIVICGYCDIEQCL